VSACRSTRGARFGRQATARRLRSLRIRLSAIRSAVAAALTVALCSAGRARCAIGCFLARALVGGHGHVSGRLFALVTSVDLPFRYVGGHRWERAFGLSSQPFAGWLKDLAKSFCLGLGATVAVGYVLLWLLATWPTWWWLAAWIMSLAVSVVLAFLAPIVLVPLFYRFRPWKIRTSGPFRIARRPGQGPIVGVFELRASEKTRRSNAAVMGLGRTRRVVVTDTLLREFRPEEVETVLAHELAHQKFLDPLRGFVLGSVTSLVVWRRRVDLWDSVFVVRNPLDERHGGLPVLAALLGLVSLPLRPLELWWSRARSHGRIDSPSSSHMTRRTSQRRWRSSTTKTSVWRTRSHGRSGCFTAILPVASASNSLGPIPHRPRKNRGIFITTQPMVTALGAEVA